MENARPFMPDFDDLKIQALLQHGDKAFRVYCQLYALLFKNQKHIICLEDVSLLASRLSLQPEYLATLLGLFASCKLLQKHLTTYTLKEIEEQVLKLAETRLRWRNYKKRSTKTPLVESEMKRKGRGKEDLNTINLTIEPSPPDYSLPEKLIELFKSQGKDEAYPNVFLKKTEWERLCKEFGEAKVDKGGLELTAWSKSFDISPKTRLPGWKSYQLKRDHAKTLKNKILSMNGSGEAYG